MNEEERWRRASEWADRFSPFRRRQPIFVGLTFALIALLTLAVFLSIAGLRLSEVWLAAVIAVTAMLLTGCSLALISNREAKSTFIAEYRRLNHVKPASGPRGRAKGDASP